MSYNFRVRELGRADNLPILKKEIRVSSSKSFITPSKSFRKYGETDFSNTQIVEISKHFDEKRIENLYEGKRSKSIESITKEKQRDKINFIIFNLKTDNIPNKDRMRILVQHLYDNSDYNIILPTVEPNILRTPVIKYKRNGESYEKKIEDETKLENYRDMMNFIIDQAELWNQKEIIGMIPLLPPKFINPIIDLYLEKGLKAFAIDANLKNVYSGMNLSQLRNILSKINETVPLPESFIYLCNPGMPRFETIYARADDFLSLFIYIDNISEIFKQRKFPPPPPGRTVTSRPKFFNEITYSYRLYNGYQEASQNFGESIDRYYMKKYNQERQLRETVQLQGQIDEGTILTYFNSKRYIDEDIKKKIRKIQSAVSIN